MNEHPILFSAPMVRAILAGEKTQTRRIVQPQPDPAVVRASVVPPWAHFEDEAGPPNEHGNREGRMWTMRCPYGAPGDRLWVREKMRCMALRFGEGVPAPKVAKAWPSSVGLRYEADGATGNVELWPERLAVPVVGKCLAYGGPREASRIDLGVTAVRVERLQDIVDADIAAEGVTLRSALDMMTDKRARTSETPVTLHDAWRLGWDAINGKRASWESNPWVWAITFRRVRP